MSEKRFQLDIGDDYCFINDKIENKTYAIYNDRFKERWSQEIVDLLNKQQDTIHSLKEENERLQKENNILNRNEDDLKECTLENEQLRKENVFLAKQRNYWKGKSDMAVETFEIDEATEKKISELEKENEQLRKEKEYYREYALQYLLEYEFYSDNFLNTIKNTISEEEVKKIKEEENKIIEALKKEGLYE